MTRSFHEVVCVDHMLLDKYCVMHITDTASYYSTDAVVDYTSMANAVVVLDPYWITPFWTPRTTIYDQAFDKKAFNTYLEDQYLEERPLSPRRLYKNVLESKRKIIHNVLERLKTSSSSEDGTWMSAINFRLPIRISSDLYGNEILPVRELAKRYPRTVEVWKPPKLLTKYLFAA